MLRIELMKPFKDYADAFRGEYNFDIICEVGVITIVWSWVSSSGF